MDIIEKVRQRILKFLRLDHLQDNPNSERYTYVTDMAEVRRQHLNECRVWYVGDSNELLNYYTGQSVYGFSKEATYNRNRANYFWGINPKENDIKRVHSGVPRAIVDTLVNAVGTPDILVANYNVKELIEKTNFKSIYNQQQMPLTLAEGWGAYKIIIDKDKRLSEYPIIQYYEAPDVEFVVKSGITIGIIYKDYYTYNKKNYLLLETRRINENGNSAIEYELFRLDNNNDVHEVELSTIPELSNLQDVEIPNYKHILGVPTRFFYDVNNKSYGRSIYDGKIDLFDDLDQSLSQRSQTSRVSTPVEYYSPDILERDRNGHTYMPKVYNRQFIQKPGGLPDGDGNRDTSIQTSQPQLNFEQYSQEQKAILDFILTGILSPATMGIDIAKKDNADAQREKEKVTIMTRNNIIDQETSILKELFSIAIAMKNYMDTGVVSLEPLDISVKFSEFANPSFESMSQTLTPMWTAGAISDDMFVNKLYGDSLSEEEKIKEKLALEENKKRDTLNLGDFENDTQPFGEDLETQRRNDKQVA